jgi:transcriptional regulator with XRE-family HTH domain
MTRDLAQSVVNLSIYENGTSIATKSLNVHVGRRIALARELADLTPEYVAQLIGVPAKQMQDFERGTARVTATMLFEIARLTATSVAFFFGDVLPAQNGAPLHDRERAAEEVFLRES